MASAEIGDAAHVAWEEWARAMTDPTGRVFRAVYGLKNPAEFRRGAKALLVELAKAS